MVATSLFADTEHPGPAQRTDEPPNSPSCQNHGIRDLLDGAARVDSDVEQDGAAARNEIEGVNGIEPPLYGNNIMSCRLLLSLPNVNLSKRAEKARGINEENAFKAIKDLLKAT